LVWLLTDGFDEPTALAATLKLFRAAGHDVVFLQIAAPEEETFPFRRPTLFRDLEWPAQQRPVDPLQLRRSYLERYQAFCGALNRDCAAAGLDHVKLVTNEPYARALGTYLTHRGQRTTR